MDSSARTGLVALLLVACAAAGLLVVVLTIKTSGSPAPVSPVPAEPVSPSPLPPGNPLESLLGGNLRLRDTTEMLRGLQDARG